MELKKRHVISAILILRFSSYVLGKKDEINEMYYLMSCSEYIASIEKLIKFTMETLEYVVALS